MARPMERRKLRNGLSGVGDGRAQHAERDRGCDRLPIRESAMRRGVDGLDEGATSVAMNVRRLIISDAETRSKSSNHVAQYGK